jgi:hypothetical protein
MRNGSSSQRGMALILALTAVLIISMLLSGILLLSVSHFSLTNTNSAFANALYAAEAGVNHELWLISHTPAQAGSTTSPTTGTLGSGSFSVYSESDLNGTVWTPPNYLWVVSTGTFDGVSRTVRVMAAGGPSGGMFGLYALFGINSIQFGGNFTVVGPMGTDGTVTRDQGSPNLNGDFWYCGPEAGGAAVNVGTGHDVYHTPLPEAFSTVNELAVARAQKAPWNAASPAPPTVDFFSTHNNNAAVKDPTGAAASFGSPPVLDDHAFTKAKVLVFPPGDYYFTSVDVASNKTIRIDDAAGPVNIWIGPEGATGHGSTATDTFRGTMTFPSSANPSNFHIYEGSRRTLYMNGNMTLYGNVLAYNGSAATGYYGSVKFDGNMTVYGSAIANDVLKGTGSGIITFETTAGQGPVPGDASYYYGFTNSWEEINPA